MIAIIGPDDCEQLHLDGFRRRGHHTPAACCGENGRGLIMADEDAKPEMTGLDVLLRMEASGQRFASMTEPNEIEDDVAEFVPTFSEMALTLAPSSMEERDLSRCWLHSLRPRASLPNPTNEQVFFPAGWREALGPVYIDPEFHKLFVEPQKTGSAKPAAADSAFQMRSSVFPIKSWQIQPSSTPSSADTSSNDSTISHEDSKTTDSLNPSEVSGCPTSIPGLLEMDVKKAVEKLGLEGFVSARSAPHTSLQNSLLARAGYHDTLRSVPVEVIPSLATPINHRRDKRFYPDLDLTPTGPPRKFDQTKP